MNVKTLETVARALDDADVPFIVVGDLAVVAHGYERLTHDLDLVIRLSPDIIRRAFHALGSIGYRPTVPVTAEEFSNPAWREQWIREKALTVLSFSSDQHRETPLAVFVDEPFDFALEYDRTLLVMIAADVCMHVLRLETLLQMKTHAGRPQDVADVAELRALHEATSG